MSNFLPPNATAQEVALAGVTDRIDAVPVNTRKIWNPQTCPANLLPWLAWALSVDEWNADWTDQQKRDTIAASFEIHSTKGTLAAVKASLIALGYSSNVVEWFQQSGMGPYTFSVDIDAGFSPIAPGIFKESTRLIEQTKNTRSHLTRLRVSSSAPVQLFAGAAQVYGIYCATGGPLRITPEYFVTGHTQGMVNVWEKIGFTFNKLASPDIMPNSTGTNVIYSISTFNNSEYMAVACNSSPRIYLYKRYGKSFVKLPNPIVLPGGAASGGAVFSPDGNWLAVSHVSGGMTIYKRDGDTFTLRGNPAAPSTTNGSTAAWSKTGEFLLICGYAEQPYIYRVVGVNFDKIGFPTTALPIYATGAAFSPVSDLLICSHYTAPFISVSTVSGMLHTKIANPASLPDNRTNCVAISPDGTLAVLGIDGAAGIAVYAISGNTLTRVPAPADLPSVGVRSVSFSADGLRLALGYGGAPYLRMYAVSGTTLTLVSNPPNVPTTEPINACKFS